VHPPYTYVNTTVGSIQEGQTAHAECPGWFRIARAPAVTRKHDDGPANILDAMVASSTAITFITAPNVPDHDRSPAWTGE